MRIKGRKAYKALCLAHSKWHLLRSFRTGEILHYRREHQHLEEREYMAFVGNGTGPYV